MKNLCLNLCPDKSPLQQVFRHLPKTFLKILSKSRNFLSSFPSIVWRCKNLMKDLGEESGKSWNIFAEIASI